MEKIKTALKTFYNHHKHFLLMLYFLIYLPWFSYLEHHMPENIHIIHMKVDDVIPFCEIFIIPYLLWFLYIGITIVYMGFYDKQEYFRLCAFLFTGMTIFLIVSTVFPNGHTLRPTEFERDNVFTYLCERLYAIDTATNIFPSIHVFNSIGVHISICHSSHTGKNRILCFASAVLMTLIILATVFLKQHSLFDVLTAFGLALIVSIGVRLAFDHRI